MTTQTFEIEQRELGWTVEPVPTYRFKAICTGDCITDEVALAQGRFKGLHKRVPRRTDWCPKCGYALFWERIAK